MNETKPRYTGVGSHVGTPPSILRGIVIIAGALEDIGYICRTGDAPECDKAFRTGVKNESNIEVYPRGVGTRESIALALRLHPNPEAARKYIDYLGRNPMQVCGKAMDDPSKFLVCWTPDGRTVGGTGLTMRVAEHFHVPIMNLFQYSTEDVIEIAKKVKNKEFVEFKGDIREIVGEMGGLLKW